MNLSAVIGYAYEEECCEAWLQESSWSRLVLTPNNRRNNCNRNGNWIDTCFNATSKKIANNRHAVGFRMYDKVGHKIIQIRGR